MNPKPTNTTDISQESLTHLAAGELTWWQAIRLRRRIAREPALAREYVAIRQMWADLRELQTAPAPARPVWPITEQKEPTMKRRLITAAMAALTLTLIGGASVVANQFIGNDIKYSVSGSGFSGRQWNFKGKFNGKILLFDENDKSLLDEKPILFGGNDPGGAVDVSVIVVDDTLAKTTLRGMGRHPIEDSEGKILGWVVLQPMTEQDQSELNQQTEKSIANEQDYVRRPERVLVQANGSATAAVQNGPGWVGGFAAEMSRASLAMEGVPGAKSLFGQPLAWKVYGKAKVTARFYTPSPTERQVAQSGSGLTRTMIEQGGSTAEYRSQSELAAAPREMRYAYERTSAPPQNVPQVYWSFGDADVGNGDSQTLVTENGDWKKTLASGKFTGYGRHIVRDKAGKTVLILDVSPLPASKPAK